MRAWFFFVGATSRKIGASAILTARGIVWPERESGGRE
jgi:hypothetical protein